MKPKSGKRDHEIYENTYYIPNDKLRLLEIPMNSNLTFQMWLFYHGKDLAKSFRPHQLWTDHKAAIVDHLRKKGIVVEGA